MAFIEFRNFNMAVRRFPPKGGIFTPPKGIFYFNQANLEDIAFYMCRGGWPDSLNEDRELSLGSTEAYFDTLFEFENSHNKKFRNKKPELLRMILRSYARNISTEVRKGVIMEDISLKEGRKLSEETFDDYLEALQDLYLLCDLEAWAPNLHSKTVFITSPTRHFYDTSIALASLGITPRMLLSDITVSGYSLRIS